MRRHLKIIALCMSIMLVSVSITSCYGKFVVTRKLYAWNGTVSDNKFVRSLVTWILIIPHVAIAVVDLGLNMIEFWTGSNPMAMEDGVKETQHVTYNDVKYDITVSKNRIEIVQRSGSEIGKITTMVYVESANAWYMKFPDGMKKIAQINSNESVDFINPFEMEAANY